MKTLDYRKQKGLSNDVNQATMAFFLNLFVSKTRKWRDNFVSQSLDESSHCITFQENFTEDLEKILASQQFPIQVHVIRLKYKPKWIIFFYQPATLFFLMFYYYGKNHII